MAYEEVHSPIITDETGQAILTKLNEIKQVLSTPADAEDINYDNTTSGMTADNVQEAVDELKSNLTEKSNLIDVVEFNRSATFNLDANQTTYVMWNIARTGYTPLGIVGLLGSGTSALAFQDHYIDGTTAYFYMRNVSGARATGISNIRVRVLYVKNS